MKQQLNNVLLIDDNEDDNFFHQIILKETGIAHSIQVAENGLEALEFLKKTNPAPELIFLDINMPKMNGFEFLEHYKNLNMQQKAKVVIIMLTTSLNPADENKAKTIAEISGFKPKPLTINMVHEIMKKHFSK